MIQKVCPFCREAFQASRFHPDQVICSAVPCQRRRRAEYHKRRQAEDADYAAQCKDARERWRAEHPGYFRSYRANRRGVISDGSEAPATPVADLIRMLQRAKNTSAKNNSATVATSKIEVFWVASRVGQFEKNNLATLKLVVIEGDTGITP
jgi:hypothetical protein